ncbi:hypothetical protein Hte_002934 [Hypoxylon texense]
MDDQTPEHNTYTLSASAVENGSIPELKKSLALARIFLPKFDTDYVQFRDEVFRDVLSHHSITIVTYMLDHEGVPVSLGGWDVNAQDGKRLIDYLVREWYGKEDLGRWPVEEKGAVVDGEQSDTDGSDMRTQPPPLLETCAAFGSVPMFKFLQEKGARPSRRILHVAVETAAGRGADPTVGASNMGVEMLHYLVDERQMDINAMDVDGPPQNPTNSHWGRPICYAARCRNGVPVVRWLLQKGADPTFKNPYSGLDALAYAREAKCDEVLGVLEEWQRTRNQGND